MPRDLLADVEAGRRIFLPVIHVGRESGGVKGALRNADVALGEAGADGVFLIEHESMGHVALNKVVAAVRAFYPDAWIGVNYLGLAPGAAFAAAPEWVDGIWADDARIHERSEAQPRAQAITAARDESGWRGLFFGGVAFKYVHNVAFEDLPAAGRAAVPFMDVVTTSATSAPGTGEAADPARVAALRSGVGAHPLALASGVTAENVAAFLPLVDIFLVASGIEESWGELDAAKTCQLAQLIHAYRPGTASDATVPPAQ